MKDAVWKLWLALGFVQVVLSWGCAQKSIESAGTQQSPSGEIQDNNSSTQNDAQDVISNAASYPLRISREFLEGPLTANVRISNGGEENQNIESAVSWRQFEPQALLPRDEEVIADFRDRKGCLSFNQVEGFDVCFTVPGDVTSVGVNGDETWLEVKKSSALSSKQCSGNLLDKPAFVQASRDGNTLKIYFTMKTNAARGAECEPKSVLIETQLTAW
ncbi:MAG: hypothetical protein AB1540_10320 [Bdellovibrionota bacterium]